MADITRQCKDCGKSFVINEGQQKWFKNKGFSYPVRCEACRQVRKQAKENQKKEEHKHE